MFGMGGSEIIVILIVALLFLGPDKLPSAAKSISKGIRDIKKQSRSLQQQIENDEQIGGAIRDLKSALRGEEVPAPRHRLRSRALDKRSDVEGGSDLAIDLPNSIHPQLPETTAEPDTTDATDATAEAHAVAPAGTPGLRLPEAVGEVDPDAPPETGSEDLAAMIKPATGTVAKGS